MEHVSEIWDYRSEDVWIFVVRGDLDAYLSMDLRTRLDRALTESPADLLVDLEEATFMDAAALGVLVAAFKKALSKQAVLRLVAPSEPARRLLRLTQTERVFPIERDLATAYERVAERIAEPEKVAGVDDAA